MDLRPGGSGHWYNPERDIAALVPKIFRHACGFLTTEYAAGNNAFNEVISSYSLSTQDFERAAESLARFILIASEATYSGGPIQAVQDSGISTLPQRVQLVVFALISQGLLATYWQVLRGSALPELVSPQFSKEGLVDQAAMLQRFFSKTNLMSKENLQKEIERCANLPAQKPL